MEEGSSPKRLKSSPHDGRPVRVGGDNVPQRLEQDGRVQNDNGVNKVSGQNGVESNQTTETMDEANLSAKLNANESPASISEKSLPLVNLTGYVEEAPCDNDPVCVISAPTGLTSSYISTLDERQLKREKRKQANRESARKSRLRKQAEYEELVTRWDSLKEENEALQSELAQLNADSDKVRRENAELMEKLKNSGVAQKGEISSSNAGADSFQTSNTSEKVLKSESITRNVLTDHNMHENSNSEAKLHQLLEPGSRSDTSIAA